jgi:hypothetical protein
LLVLLIPFFSGFSVNAQTPKGSFASEDFSISNMTAIRQDDSTNAQSFNILGIVKNISNRTIGNIQIVGDLYDPTNQFIDVVTGYPSFSTLPPRGESSFKLEYRTDNNSSVVDHYVIHVGRGSNQLGQLVDLLGNMTK